MGHLVYRCQDLKCWCNKGQEMRSASPRPLWDRQEYLVAHAYTLTCQNGGATLSLQGDNLVGRPGYAVGLPGGEVMLYPMSLASFAVQVKSVLWRAQGAGLDAIGTWVDNGRLYIDPVKIVMDERTAIALGRQHGQQAIYDLQAERSIEVDGCHDQGGEG